jgi:HSP20 family protein
VPDLPVALLLEKTKSRTGRCLQRVACPASGVQQGEANPSRISRRKNTNLNPSITMRLVRYTYPDQPAFAPAALLRNPWAGLDHLFSPAYTDASFPAEVDEDKDNLVVRADLPGVAREDIAIELTGDLLNVTATRKARNGDDREAVTYRRLFRVADGVQADKVKAALENGVLTVTLPKAEALKPRQITIN